MTELKMQYIDKWATIAKKSMEQKILNQSYINYRYEKMWKKILQNKYMNLTHICKLKFSFF